jgi:hypothetical protein
LAFPLLYPPPRPLWASENELPQATTRAKASASDAKRLFMNVLLP